MRDSSTRVINGVQIDSARPRNPLREIAAPIDKLYGLANRQLGVRRTKVLTLSTQKMYSR